MTKYILGVKVDDVSMEESLKIVSSWLDDKQSTINHIHYIVTPNPEFIMQAQRDPEFKEILNKADLSIPDGSGLKLSGKIHHTVAGVDFMDRLCGLAEKRGYSIGLLGGTDGVAKMATAALKKRYPNLKVAFVEEGGSVDKDGQSNLKFKISNLKLDILFVAFGHGKQERWIVKNIDSFPAKVFMGVGGSFDYISGRVPRAPKWMRSLGFEWVFRLVIQPWRIKRQLDLIRFAWKLFAFRWLTLSE